MNLELHKDKIFNVFKESGKDVLSGQYIKEHLDIDENVFTEIMDFIYLYSDMLIINPNDDSDEMSGDMTQNDYGLTTYYKRKLILEELEI